MDWVGAGYSDLTDQMRQEMGELATVSYEYYILPDSLGGGEGSFEYIKFKKIAEDVEIEYGSYTLDVKADTLLKLRGVHRSPGDFPEKDTLILDLYVYPSDVIDWDFKMNK